MDRQFYSDIRTWIIVWALAAGLLALPVAAVAGGAAKASGDSKASVWESPLGLFQAIISKADGQRCPMYPSCSHYAAEAVEKHGKILGWLLTGDRLLRCGRDETRLAPQVMTQGGRRSYDPLKANTFWWSGP